MNRLKYKLENIQHAYFCFEKECPVCDGFNYFLNENFHEKFQLPSEVNKIQSCRSIAEIGTIWEINSDAPYPIYILPLEKFNYFYRCLRVSEFTEFKGEFDIVWKEWMFECWNTFPVLNIRFARKIEEVPKDIFEEILKTCNEFENFDNENYEEKNVFIEHFREMDLDYQNMAFLDNDEDILLNIEEKSGYEKSNVLSFRDYVERFNLNGKKSSIAVDESTKFEEVKLAAADEHYFRTGIDSAKVLYRDDNIIIFYNFIKKQQNKFIRFYFELYFEKETERVEIFCNGKKIDFTLLSMNMENIYLDIPLKTGDYEIIMFFDDNIKLPVKFTIN